MTKDGETPPPPPPITTLLFRSIVNFVELFEFHWHAYDVLDHIDPSTPRPTNISETMWKRRRLDCEKVDILV